MSLSSAQRDLRNRILNDPDLRAWQLPDRLRGPMHALMRRGMLTCEATTCRLVLVSTELANAVRPAMKEAPIG